MDRLFLRLADFNRAYSVLPGYHGGWFAGAGLSAADHIRARHHQRMVRGGIGVGWT